MRLPVLRLMMLKRTRWLVLVAEYIATEHDTNDNLRKPFQFGRGAMAKLLYANAGRERCDDNASSIVRATQRWAAPARVKPACGRARFVDSQIRRWRDFVNCRRGREPR